MNYFSSEIDNLFGSMPKGRIEEIAENKTINSSKKVRHSSSLISFDSNGNELKREFYDDGELTYEMHSQYDKKNQLESRKSSNHKDRLQIVESYENGVLMESVDTRIGTDIRFTNKYLYDTKKRLIYNARFTSDGQVYSKKDIVYASGGNRVETERFGQPEIIDTTYLVRLNNDFVIEYSAANFQKKSLLFNSENNPTDIYIFSVENKIIRKYTLIYDEFDFLKELNDYFEVSNMQFPQTTVPTPLINAFFALGSAYEYIRLGDLRQSIQCLVDIPLESKRTYTWNSARRLVFEKRFVLGRLVSTTEHIYSAEGNLIQKLRRNKSEQIVWDETYSWETDTHENWIVCEIIETTVSKRGVSTLKKKVVRDIRYY